MNTMVVPVVIFAGLVLVQTLWPAVSHWYFSRFQDGRRAGLSDLLGPRDNQPEVSQSTARARRALQNFTEASLLFLPALVLVMTLSSSSLAVTGAWVFVIARVVYLPCYLFGVYAMRTVAWSLGHFGVGMMFWSLL